jgi:hypothetical protein
MNTKHVPLSEESRAFINTETAAHHLLRKPQTLRLGFCKDTLPAEIKPKVLGGRLAWPVEGIKKYLAA